MKMNFSPLFLFIVTTNAINVPTNKESSKTEPSEKPSETIKTVNPIETVNQLKKKIEDEYDLQLFFYKNDIEQIPEGDRRTVRLIVRGLAKEIAKKDHGLAEKDQEAKLLIGNLTAARLENKRYEKVLRIISARSTFEGLVDKLYPLREDSKTHEMIYGKPRSMGYCEALNEILISKNKRFTQDPYVCMVRQRLIDRNIEVKDFMKFARWLYSQFSDKACHKMAQFAPPLPEYNDIEEIKEMFKAVEISPDIPALVCMQIILEPLELPPSNTTVALPNDTTVALTSDTTVALTSDTTVALTSDTTVALTSDTTVALTSDTTVALTSDTKEAPPSDTKEAPPSDTVVAPPSGS